MKKTEIRPEIIELDLGRDRKGRNKKGETHRYSNPGEYDKVTSDLRNLWVRHEILGAFQKELEKREAKDSYEDFIYGYMYYFDNHSPEENWDVEKDGAHKIYFKWNEDHNGVTSVDIFIIPRPIVPFKLNSTIVNPAPIDPERPPAPPPPPANP